MNRVVLFFVIIFLFLVSLVSGYLYVKSVSRDVNPAVKAIPEEAAVIYESNTFWQDWQKQSSTSLIFKELRRFDKFTRYDSVLVSLDSTIKAQQQFDFLFNDQPVMVSVIQSGAKDFDLLYTFSIPAEVSNDQFLATFEGLFPGFFTSRTKEFDGATVRSFSHKEHFYHFSLYKDIFCLSKNSLLIEDAVKQLNSATPLNRDRSYSTVSGTKGMGNEGHLLINPDHFFELINSTLSEQVFEGGHSNFSNWMAFDLLLKPNSLMLNGLVHNFDSTHNYLGRYSQQKPQEIEVVKILPSSTCFLLHNGLSNFKSYYKKYTDGLASTNSTYDYRKQLKALNDSLGEATEKRLLDHVENEFGLFITEPVLGNVERNCFAFFRCKFPDEAVKQLGQVAQLADSAGEGTEKGKLYKMPARNFLQVLFGKPYGLITEHYFTLIDNYLVFGNNLAELKELLIKNQNNNVLSKDLNYNAYAENIASESNLFLYLNIARSPQLLENVLSEKTGALFEQNVEFFRQFEAVSMQFSKNEGELFYANLYLNHNPGYKQESGSLWELTLDTTISRKPFVFVNHYTQAKELFVQDEAGKVYLVSNTGKLLWSKQLDTQIKGEVYMVDAYKNNKYQLLFNTENAVHLLDRNGKYVEDYPIGVNGPIAPSIKLLDYDNDKDYRILVPTTSGEILNFNIMGEKVSGWEYKKGPVPAAPIRFFKLNRKDYITLVYADGSMKFLNRRGENRLNIENKLPVSSNNAFYIVEGNELSSTFIATTDSTGNLHRLYLDDHIEIQTQEKALGKGHHFVAITPEGDQTQFLFAEKSNLFIMNSDFDEVFYQGLESDSLLPPQVFYTQSKKLIIAITDMKSGRVYLFNKFGLISGDYPLKSTGEVAIADLNMDGVLNLISASGDKLLTYSLH